MVKELSYTTISNVLESWEMLKRLDNYEIVAGTKLFQHLFDKCPKAKTLFGFPVDIDTTSAELLESKRFLVHSTHLLDMISSALEMLGPDIELLGEVLTELGQQHVSYGVTKEFFPFMGDALIQTLKELLKDAFDDNMEKHWRDTYQTLSEDMIFAQK